MSVLSLPPNRSPAHHSVGEEPVRWLSPTQLWQTALEVVQSTVFAKYADKREVMAGVEAPVFTLDDSPSVWFDYVSDTGDGFNATYATASALASAPCFHIATHPPCSCDRDGRLADLLVLGGDQVYPVASADGYGKRLDLPLLQAWQSNTRAGPIKSSPVVALPGNHDWYDGLVSFRRAFCEAWAKKPYPARPVDAATGVQGPLTSIPAREDRDQIGGWGAFQARSYFSIRLTEDWWLWGLDSQLDKPVDAVQLRYFRDAAGLLGDSGNVILCTATPSWLRAKPGVAAVETDDPLHTLVWFIDRVMSGGDRRQIRAVLTGDKHHLAHYAPAPEVPAGTFAPHLVTCGGGGAFLSPTHHLPPRLEVPWDASLNDSSVLTPPQVTAYELDPTRTYPSADVSKGLTGRGKWLQIIWRNGNLPWAILGLEILLLLSARQVGHAGANFTAHGEWSREYTLGGDLVVQGLWLFAALLPALLLWGMLWAFAKHGTKGTAKKALWPAALHTTAHYGLAVVIVWLVFGAFGDLGQASFGVAAVVAVLVAWLLGNVIFAAYLHLSNRRGYHELEAFSGMRFEGYKCHLRVEVDAQGAHLHAIGIESVPDFRGTNTLDLPVQAHHIGQPIHIPPFAAQP